MNNQDGKGALRGVSVCRGMHVQRAMVHGIRGKPGLSSNVESAT
jgi:hypothetical protein